MKRSMSMLLSVLCVLMLGRFANAAVQTGPDAWTKQSFVIVYATKEYRHALRVAQDVARKTGVRLNLRGLSPHPQSHLTFSLQECANSEFDYPCYLTRAYDDDGEYLTIDWSNGFDDFQPGYFIVTAAGGNPGDPQLAKTLQRVKPIFPGAYIKTTRVYIGCMH